MYSVYVCVYMRAHIHTWSFIPPPRPSRSSPPFIIRLSLFFFLVVSLSQATGPHVANYTHRGVISLLSMSRSMLENRLRAFYDASVELHIRLVGV